MILAQKFIQGGFSTEKKQKFTERLLNNQQKIIKMKRVDIPKISFLFIYYFLYIQM